MWAWSQEKVGVVPGTRYHTHHNNYSQELWTDSQPVWRDLAVNDQISAKSKTELNILGYDHKRFHREKLISTWRQGCKHM